MMCVADGCTRPIYVKRQALCSLHYNRARNGSSPAGEDRDSANGRFKENQIDAILGMYEPEPMSGCWLWTGHADGNGYGVIRFSGKARLAHRIFYERHVGNPSGLNVLHKCDTPSCVNPLHLYLGTHAQNAADRVARNCGVYGEIHPGAKLSTAEVIAIRSEYALGAVTRGQLAARFGISETTLRYVATGKTWRHLPALKREKVSRGASARLDVEEAGR